ncbi:MAG: PQQ-binding-like beta-propeller repeat protein, partial [Ignavibacteriaceae bacterium]|nr:PQQ-binding-like beta-propeller repeat protein [Ignavibacteriaceae bacterium]
WASLADSPWPALHMDMQRTGRSKYTGPQQGVLFASISGSRIATGITMGNDSVFYFATTWPPKLIAAKIDGSILWQFDLYVSETGTTPMVGYDGTIYVSNGSPGIITAINPDGSVKWECSSSSGVYNRGIGIGKDGTIYAVEYGSSLIAISPNGELLWRINDDNFAWGYRVNLAFSPDGNILYLHGNKIGGVEITLIAFNLITKTTKWKFGGKLLDNGPVINSQGNIFVLVQDDTTNYQIANLYCLDPDGNVKWKYKHTAGQSYYGQDPTIDKDGNIYFATDTLYSLDYNGNLRWKRGLLGNQNFSPLACDNQGTVYLGTINQTNNNVLAITKDGNLKWILPIDGPPAESPAITSNGTLIYTIWTPGEVVFIK